MIKKIIELINNKFLLCLIGYFLLTFVSTSQATSLPGVVQDLQSFPATSANTMAVTQITFTWSYPVGYTDGSLSSFLYTFSKNSTETISWSNMGSIIPSNTLTKSISTSAYTEVDMYFHIAAFIGTDFGETAHLGSYRIDNVAPTSPHFTALTETNDINIQITNIGADGATKMCCWISDHGSCNYGGLENTDLILPNEEGTYQINVRFSDDAGNETSTLSKNIKYTPIVVESGMIAGVPSLSEWGMIILMGILMISSIKVMNKQKSTV